MTIFHNLHFLNIWQTNLNFLFVHLNLKATICLISSFLFRIILILKDILKDRGRLITMFAGIQFIFIEFWWSRRKKKKLCRQALQRDTALIIFLLRYFTIFLQWNYFGNIGNCNAVKKNNKERNIFLISLESSPCQWPLLYCKTIFEITALCFHKNSSVYTVCSFEYNFWLPFKDFIPNYVNFVQSKIGIPRIK